MLAKLVVVTSIAQLNNGEYVSVRKCSEPEADILRIYDALKIDHTPIKMKKFVWTQKPDLKKQSLEIRYLAFETLQCGIKKQVDFCLLIDNYFWNVMPH